MNTAIVQRSVDFHGDGLVAIQQDGIGYTPVKPFCEFLGLDWEKQRERIQSDEVLSEVAKNLPISTPLKGGADQTYTMLCLPLEYLNGWLFGVQVNRIRPELRERLILYKRDCYRALARAFQGGQEHTARLDAMEARIAALEAGQGAPRALQCVVSPLASDILSILQAHPHGGPVSCRAIIAALRERGHEVYPRPTWLRLRRMAARGLILRCGRGAYRLA